MTKRRRKTIEQSRYLWIWDDNESSSFEGLLKPFLQNFIIRGGKIEYGFPMYFASLNDSDLQVICDKVNEHLKELFSQEELDSCPDTNPRSVEELLQVHQWIPNKHLQDLIYKVPLDNIKNILLKDSFGKSNKTLNRLEELEKTFMLTTAEKSILLYSFLLETNNNYSNYLDHLYENKIVEFRKHLSIVCDISLTDIEKAFSEDSRLIQCGILKDISEQRSNTLLLKPTSEVVSYLNGLGNDSFIELICEKIDVSNAMDLEEYSFSNLSKQICYKLLTDPKGCNLLFHGAPGLGKTSFCHSLTKVSGKNLLRLKTSTEKNDIGRIQMAISSMTLGRDILLIDEADAYLNTFLSFFGSVAKVEKGVMNQLLESHKKSLIWITNRVNAIDKSTCRRFSYSLEFKDLDDPQRKNMWQKIINEQGVESAPFSVETATKYFSKYSMTPANMKSILKASALFIQGDVTSDLPIQAAKEIAKQQIDLCGISRVHNELKPTSKYCIDFVNTDIPLASLIKSCQTYLDRQDEADYPIHNVSMLFYGAPGCGKTEFAKHLAHALGKKLILKKASDIMDKYIGESEKNIAAAFREAEENGDLLFIDEADSLLQDRSGAQRSWEVTQVNELLVQMEQFRGIVLFSTNFEKLLDKASLRRFHFKVRFDAIQENHLEGVFEEYFKMSLNHGVTDAHAVKVKDLRGVTLGDFKVVSYRLALGQIEANVADLFAALILEKSSRGEKKSLGF